MFATRSFLKNGLLLCNKAKLSGSAMFSTERSKGTVIFFNAVKGFGFIRPNDNSPDVFVHFSELKVQGFKSVNADQEVEYTVQANEEKGGKLCAINVTGPNGKTLLGDRPRDANSNYNTERQPRRDNRNNYDRY